GHLGATVGADGPPDDLLVMAQHLVGHPVSVPGPQLGRPLHIGEQDGDRVAVSWHGSPAGRHSIWWLLALPNMRGNFNVSRCRSGRGGRPPAWTPGSPAGGGRCRGRRACPRPGTRSASSASTGTRTPSW